MEQTLHARGLRGKSYCMINYSMKYGVSEVAIFFDVDRNTVKRWANLFIDYLSSSANPIKGESRQYTIDDLRILAYISIYWEDDPDLVSIKYGLNSNNHLENDLIDNFIIGLTPLFRNMPDDIDESWRGVVLGGEF